ncbi:MAG: hypothetical protein WA814_12830 [Candidatus Baltobacteraceae bacterium]
MQSSTYGAGPHGYDWAIGTWTCTNTVPSAMGGPTNTTLTVVRTNNGALLYRSVGTNFDNTWYNVYLPKTKSWVSPFILADGSYGTESTAQTGGKIVWTGTAFDAASGKTMAIRDTNTIGTTKYGDLGEYRSHGAWKTQYEVTCTKTS